MSARHAYLPVSPCGPGCLTGGEPTVGRLRAAGRLAAAAGVVLTGALTAPLLPIAGRRGRTLLVRALFRAVLRAFGVTLRVRGTLSAVPGRGALVVSNHISWLDVVAVNAVQPMRALAKRDIRSWPVLGPLVTSAGTIYLDRERLRTLPATVEELAGALRGGQLVTVCPEGTTWCGQGPGRFRTALFQAAIDGGVPVRPVALSYLGAGGRETPAPAFIGDETIIDSVRRVARLRGLTLQLTVCDEIAPGRAADRAELAALAHAAVNSALGRTTLPERRGQIVADTRRMSFGVHS